MNATAAKSILKEGMIVSTKLGATSPWYNNIIYKIENDEIILSLMDSYLENTIMLHSHFMIKYSNEHFEYIFDGTVTDINPMEPRTVTITVKKAEELVNTRFFPRYDTYIASTINPSWGSQPVFAIVNNICLGGMAFLCKQEFDYGEEADVCVYIRYFGQICTKGKIIRKNKKNNLFDYSMQFTHMDEATSILLSDYLTSIDAVSQELVNDFSRNIKGKI